MTQLSAAARLGARFGEEAKKRLGERFKALLKARHLSQADIAEMSGLNRNTISDLATGASDPFLSTLVAVAQALDLHSLEELVAPHGLQLLMNNPTFDSPPPELPGAATRSG